MRYSNRSHMVDGGRTECFCRDPESHVVPLGSFAIPVSGEVNMNSPLTRTGPSGVLGMDETEHERVMAARRERRWTLAGIWGLRILFLCIFVLGFWAGYLVGVAGWGT